MAKSADVLFGAPGLDFLRGRQLFSVDGNDGRVRFGELGEAAEGFDVDLLRDREAVSARFGEADDLLEPRRPGRFDVEPGVVLFDQLFDDGIERELVACRSGR